MIAMIFLVVLGLVLFALAWYLDRNHYGGRK